jgi:hypothetical protein
MLLYLVIFLSFVGCVGAVADYYLGPKQKERLNLAIGNAWICLASVKSGPIVSRARGRLVFSGSIVAAAAGVFALLADVPTARWNLFTRLLETETRVTLSLPFLWWLSRADSVRSLFLRAFLSAVSSFAILLALMWVDIWPFHDLSFIGVSMDGDEARDFLVFLVGVLTVLTGVPFMAGTAAAVLPVPLAYAGLGILAAAELTLRLGIDRNRGAFIAICALFGAIATFIKLFVH